MEDQAPSAWQSLRPGDLRRRYFDFLCRFVNELAARGNVLLVGRGGNRLLQSNPWAIAVRLIAPMADRIRRVMEHHWLREEQARKRIAESDMARQRRHASLFGGDWSNPLDYHATANVGRLGMRGADLIADLTSRLWQRVAAGKSEEVPG
jgi:cytidylate kinase